MSLEPLQRLADLLRQRNAIDSQLATILRRPVTPGHLGEYVAARIFDIQLERSASSKGIDGHFTAGPLAGRTVDIKWYGKNEGLLDIAGHDVLPDIYLVMTGPKAAPVSSVGAIRPWCIVSVFVFETMELVASLRSRGVRIGTASSVASAYWAAAEIHPRSTSPLLRLSDEQRRLLELFAAPAP